MDIALDNQLCSIITKPSTYDTGSQMSSNGLGQRIFRLDESCQTETLSSRDQIVRNTATVHVLRSKYTTADIRNA